MLQPRRHGRRRKNGKDLTYSPIPGANGSFWGLVFADYLEDIVSSTEIVTENPNIFFNGTDAVLDYSSVTNEDNIEELKVFFQSTVKTGESVTIENGEYLDLMNLDQKTYDLGMTATFKSFDEDNLMVFLESVSVNNKSTLTDRYKKEFFLNNIKWTAESSTLIDSIKINEIVNTFGVDSANSFRNVLGEILPNDQIILQIDKSKNVSFTVVDYNVGAEGEERIAVREPVPNDSGSDYFGKEVFATLKRKVEPCGDGAAVCESQCWERRRDEGCWFAVPKNCDGTCKKSRGEDHNGDPIRTCIACQEEKPTDHMICTNNNEPCLQAGPIGKTPCTAKNSEGNYICPNGEEDQNENCYCDQYWITSVCRERIKGWRNTSECCDLSKPTPTGDPNCNEPDRRNRSSGGGWWNVTINNCSIVLPGCVPDFRNEEKPSVQYATEPSNQEYIGDPENCLSAVATADKKCPNGGMHTVWIIRNRITGETTHISGPCCGGTNTTANVGSPGRRNNRTPNIRIENNNNNNTRSEMEKKHEEWKKSGSITLRAKIGRKDGHRVFKFSGAGQENIIRPTLSLQAGQTIRINMTDKELGNQGTHPLSFATVPDGTHRNKDSELDGYITRSGKKPGERGSYLYYTVPSDPRYATHYYFCKNHEGMGFKVEVQREGTQRSNPPGLGGGGDPVIDVKPKEEDVFPEPDPDIKDSNTCCKGDCRNCLQQAINCVETRGCRLDDPLPGDDNGNGVRDPNENDPYNPLNGCDKEHPQPSKGEKACGPYGIKRVYAHEGRRARNHDPQCDYDADAVYEKLCSKCNGNPACCQEKARLSRLVMECVIRHQSRNPDLGQPCDCEGHGGAPAPGLPATAKKDCLTCEDIAMKQIGTCCHRCLPGDTMPKNKDDKDCCGADGCRQAIDYWKKVTRYMDFYCPECMNCTCTKGSGGTQTEQRSMPTTTPRPTTTTRPTSRTTTTRQSSSGGSMGGGMSSGY